MVTPATNITIQLFIYTYPNTWYKEDTNKQYLIKRNIQKNSYTVAFKKYKQELNCIKQKTLIE